MRVILQFEMRVSAPTKTTTGISLECLGVKVERTAGSVQRAVEDALSVFGHELRKPLLKEARDARAQTAPPGPRTIIDKNQEPEAEDMGGALPETFVLPPITVPALEALMGQSAHQDPDTDPGSLFHPDSTQHGPLVPQVP
jgi:hypothetical protein